MDHHDSDLVIVAPPPWPVVAAHHHQHSMPLLNCLNHHPFPPPQHGDVGAQALAPEMVHINQYCGPAPFHTQFPFCYNFLHLIMPS